MSSELSYRYLSITGWVVTQSSETFYPADTNILLTLEDGKVIKSEVIDDFT